MLKPSVQKSPTPLKIGATAEIEILYPQNAFSAQHFPIHSFTQTPLVTNMFHLSAAEIT